MVIHPLCIYKPASPRRRSDLKHFRQRHKLIILLTKGFDYTGQGLYCRRAVPDLFVLRSPFSLVGRRLPAIVQ